MKNSRFGSADDSTDRTAFGRSAAANSSRAGRDDRGGFFMFFCAVANDPRGAAAAAAACCVGDGYKLPSVISVRAPDSGHDGTSF